MNLLANIQQVRQFIQRSGGIFGPHAAILLYHRVSELVPDPCILRVTPQHFAEHLQVIRDLAYPMQLNELVCRLRNGKLPPRAVCLTFDDGYRDNLLIAKPLLERFDIPATAFMTTGTSGRSHEFWWDELERVFLEPGHLPDHLGLTVGGQYFAWNLGEFSEYGADAAQQYEAWTLLNPDDATPSYDPTPRHRIFREIHHLLSRMDIAPRQQLLDHLLSWAKLAPTLRPSHRALEPHEMVGLERGGLIEVGSHTVNHPALSKLPAAGQREEIRQGKLMLEDWLGHRVRSFAYPYGCYSKESVTAVRELGFEYACACLYRPVLRNSDPFLLPRVSVLNWDGDEFARCLKKNLGG